MEIKNLLLLAGHNSDAVDDEFTTLVGGGSIGNAGDFAKSITDHMSQVRKDASAQLRKSLMAEVIAMLKTADAQVISAIEALRKHRRLANNGVSRVKAIRRAAQYGLATQNFIPLSILLDNGGGETATAGSMVRHFTADMKGLDKVPDDWVAPEEIEAAAKKAVKAKK